MKMQSVKSSNIDSVGFEKGVLRVDFKSGDRFEYHGVPETLYRDLVAAKSPGAFLHHQIKGTYKAKKLT
jgi:hypothetical protein